LSNQKDLVLTVKNVHKFASLSENSARLGKKITNFLSDFSGGLIVVDGVVVL
jgi:hypothetical protein